MKELISWAVDNINRVLTHYDNMSIKMQILIFAIMLLSMVGIAIILDKFFKLYERKKNEKIKKEEKNRLRYFIWDNKTRSFVSKIEYNNRKL